jgi:glyoxylase-like metal-dependent hydrolase (beta-lactamase superfamily II)
MSSIRRQRHPANAPGDWYVDDACIDCGASTSVAPGLIEHRGGQRVFVRQPRGRDQREAAWRAFTLCPTASVHAGAGRKAPAVGLYPHELAPGVFRCGFNARSSFGAHSYWVRRETGNLLIDSPRYLRRLAEFFAARGGIADVLLTHRDDVADAGRYAERFGSRVWIHEHDADAAPFATHLIRGREATSIRAGLLAIPVPGHTRGSVCYLLESAYLFTGDSLAWSHRRGDLTAFREACWYSWHEQKASLGRLAAYSFEWVLAGHGDSSRLSANDMRERLEEYVARM